MCGCLVCIGTTNSKVTHLDKNCNFSVCFSSKWLPFVGGSKTQSTRSGMEVYCEALNIFKNFSCFACFNYSENGNGGDFDFFILPSVSRLNRIGYVKRTHWGVLGVGPLIRVTKQKNIDVKIYGNVKLSKPSIRYTSYSLAVYTGYFGKVAPPLSVEYKVLWAVNIFNPTDIFYTSNTSLRQKVLTKNKVGFSVFNRFLALYELNRNISFGLTVKISYDSRETGLVNSRLATNALGNTELYQVYFAFGITLYIMN